MFTKARTGPGLETDEYSPHSHALVKVRFNIIFRLTVSVVITTG